MSFWSSLSILLEWLPTASHYALCCNYLWLSLYIPLVQLAVELVGQQLTESCQDHDLGVRRHDRRAQERGEVADEREFLVVQRKGRDFASLLGSVDFYWVLLSDSVTIFPGWVKVRKLSTSFKHKWLLRSKKILIHIFHVTNQHDSKSTPDSDLPPSSNSDASRLFFSLLPHLGCTLLILSIPAVTNEVLRGRIEM